jgi:hypothetical protein
MKKMSILKKSILLQITNTQITNKFQVNLFVHLYNIKL